MRAAGEVFCLLKKEWNRLLAAAVLVLFTGAVLLTAHANSREFIRYAEFNVPYAALDRALAEGIESEGAVGWVDVLAYLSARYGGEWKRYKPADLDR